MRLRSPYLSGDVNNSRITGSERLSTAVPHQIGGAEMMRGRRKGHALSRPVSPVAIRVWLRRAQGHRCLALFDDRVAGDLVVAVRQGHRMGSAGYNARFVRLRPVCLHEQTIG